MREQKIVFIRHQAAEAKELLNKIREDFVRIQLCLEAIDMMTDEVEKTCLPGSGEWIESDIPGEEYRCSICGGAAWYYDVGGNIAKSKFCPNCGAKMGSE